MLNLKIVVSLTETGAIEVLHKAKGMKNAVNYIVKLMAERTREVGPSVYYKLHTKAYKALEYMDRALEKVDAPAATCMETWTWRKSLSVFSSAMPWQTARKKWNS